MALEIEVELDWVRNVCVDDGARGAVARALVALVRPLREEADVVALADDDDGDLWVDVEGFAGGWVEG